MRTLLGRVPSAAVVAPPLEPGDLVAMVEVSDYRVGERVVVLSPGSRPIGGLLVRCAAAWWVMVGTAELVALGPETTVFALLILRPV